MIRLVSKPRQVQDLPHVASPCTLTWIHNHATSCPAPDNCWHLLRAATRIVGRQQAWKPVLKTAKHSQHPEVRATAVQPERRRKKHRCIPGWALWKTAAGRSFHPSYRSPPRPPGIPRAAHTAATVMRNSLQRQDYKTQRTTHKAEGFESMAPQPSTSEHGYSAGALVVLSHSLLLRLRLPRSAANGRKRCTGGRCQQMCYTRRQAERPHGISQVRSTAARTLVSCCLGAALTLGPWNIFFMNILGASGALRIAGICYFSSGGKRER